MSNPRHTANPTPTSTESLLDHAQWAHALARRLVGDASRADDVVQEAYAAALQHPPTEPGALRPWFARVLTNVARMQLRSSRRRCARERTAAADPTLPSPSELAERAEGQRTLVAAVLKLEEPYRATVLLRYFEDLSAAEIARRQDIPAATVRWRLQEALAKLRSELDEEFGGDTRSWCSLLLPLATMRTPGLPLATVTPSLLSAVVIMKLIKTAAVAGCLFVGLFFLAAQGLLPGFGLGTTEVDLPPETVSFRSIPEQTPALAQQRPPVQNKRSTVTQTKPAKAASKSFATIVAQFVDENGRAIEGVSFRETYRTANSSDCFSQADGSIEVKLGNDSTYKAWGQATLIAIHPNFANQRFPVHITKGKRIDLGTIVLSAGGSIQGHVRDEAGLPMPGIKVFVTAREIVENHGSLSSHTEGNVGRAETKTDEHGEFVLGGVLAGLRTVHATDNKHMKVKSGSVEVKPGQQSFGVEIVLKDPTPQALRITGVVLDPDGKPVPRSFIEFKFSTFFGMSNGSGSTITNTEGAFRIDARDKSAKYRLLARSETEEIGPGVIENARPGKDYTIRLTRPESFEVTVKDEHGSALPGATVHIQRVVYGSDRAQTSNITNEHGAITAKVPLARFKVTAFALGYEEREFGPFEPADVDPNRPIPCVLATAPVLRGRVTANGKPIAFASVDLHHRCEEEVVHNGFPVWLKPRDFADAKTDEDGAWAVTMRSDKPFYVRVTAPKFAIYESQEFDAARAQDTTPLAVELDHGGIIQGRVTGPKAAGTIVGISRGDGAGRTMTVGASGEFRFDNLTPGRYIVQERDHAIEPGANSTNSRWGAPIREIKWVCKVFAGKVTRYDLGTAVQTTCTLNGRLQLGNQKLNGWTASLMSVGMQIRKVPRQQLDMGGAFRLSVQDPGKYRLLIKKAGESFQRSIITELSLQEGSNDFSLDVEEGSLEVSGLRKSPIPSILLWEGARGVMLAISLPKDGRERCTLEGVPAGAVRVVGWTNLQAIKSAMAATGANDDPRKWPVLGTAQVSAGQKSQLKLER